MLQPEEDTAGRPARPGQEIIRNRVDALGVAEPEITRQGDAIVVNLPGVEDQRERSEVVGQTAELHFRPVLAVTPPGRRPSHDDPTATPRGGRDHDDGRRRDHHHGIGSRDDRTDGSRGRRRPRTTTPRPADRTQAPPPTDDPTVPVTLPRRRTTTATGFPTPATSSVRCPWAATRSCSTGEVSQDAQAVDPPERVGGAASTSSRRRTGHVQRGGRAVLQQRSDPAPAGSSAITLDGRVESAPRSNRRRPSSNRSAATRSRSAAGRAAFSEQEAKDLALVLRYGALPVELEPQTVQTVSATLGRDSLDAGLIAGLVGWRWSPSTCSCTTGPSAWSWSWAWRVDGADVLDHLLPRRDRRVSPSPWRASPASSCRSASPSTPTSSTSSA